MDERRPYAIMRIGKIKSFAVLAAVEHHNTRQIPCGIVEGGPQPQDCVQMDGSLCERARSVLEKLGATFDKGKVLAVEIMVTASPEWWEKASDEDKKDWYRAQWQFANDVGGPGLISFVVHNDESTPHVQFVVLPLYQAIKKKTGPKPVTPEDILKREQEEARATKIWRLSHHEVFGGSPVKLAKLQTRYHGYVAHLGLARGRDTVGLGIKHQTLKHYKQLLTNMERDLALWQQELHEERAILAHYDSQVGEAHRELARKLQFLESEERRIHALDMALTTRTVELDKRENALDNRERTISADEKSLLTRTAAIDVDKKVVTTQLEALKREQETLAADQNELAINQKNLDGRTAAVDAREVAIQAEGELLRSKNVRQKTVENQLSILDAVFTGKLAASWNPKLEQPAITNGKLGDAEASALVESWPDWLAKAMQRAVEMATERSRIAQQVRRIIARLRTKRRDADAATVRATNANAAAEQAKRVEAIAQQNTLKAQREFDSLSARKVEIETELPTLLEEQGAIKKQRDAIQTEVSELTCERAGLLDEKAKVEVDRNKLERDRNRFERSQALINDLYADRCKIEFGKDAIRVTAGPDAPDRRMEIIPTTELAAFVPHWAKLHGGLVGTIGRVEGLATELRNRRIALGERFPAEALNLAAEQQAETVRITKTIGAPPAGFDDFGR